MIHKEVRSRIWRYSFYFFWSSFFLGSLSIICISSFRNKWASTEQAWLNNLHYWKFQFEMKNVYIKIDLWFVYQRWLNTFLLNLENTTSLLSFEPLFTITLHIIQVDYYITRCFVQRFDQITQKDSHVITQSKRTIEISLRSRERRTTDVTLKPVIKPQY